MHSHYSHLCIHIFTHTQPNIHIYAYMFTYNASICLHIICIHELTRDYTHAYASMYFLSIQASQKSISTSDSVTLIHHTRVADLSTLIRNNAETAHCLEAGYGYKIISDHFQIRLQRPSIFWTLSTV